MVPALLEWVPVAALGVDATGIRRAVAAGVDEEASWLRHPCLARLFNPRAASSLQGDLHLVTWTAANRTEVCGEVTLAEEAYLWTPREVVTLPPGRHSLSRLGEAMRQPGPVSLPLDVWCRTVSFRVEGAREWNDGLSEEEKSQLHREIVEYCRTIALLEARLSPVQEWVLAATRVVIPMRKDGRNLVHSGSQANLPGMVYTDLHGSRMQILETLVHETAHNHLYASEAAEPLVDPAHTGRYHSPLRPEPRPLRGILLAYHALAYICAAFVDAMRDGYIAREAACETFTDLGARRDEAEGTLVANRLHLTTTGDEFLTRTLLVAQYGRG